MKRRAPASDIAFDALLDAAVDAIIIIDHRGTIERVNRATLQLFGYDEEELLGRNVKVLMPEPHRSRHDGYLENYLGGGEAGIIGRGREENAVRKNGEAFPILLTVSEVQQVNCFGASDGQATVELVGGVGPFEYFWSNDGTAPTETNLPAGSYTVTISDAGSCTAVANVTIEEPARAVAVDRLVRSVVQAASP